VSMPGNDDGFGAVLDDMDADTRKGVKLLTTSSVARTDSKPLTSIDTFVEGQRRTLAPALSKLSPANQERALRSATLLDSVSRRAESLRTGLACDNVTSAGADALGPKLKSCTTHDNSAGQSPSRPSGHSGKAVTRPGGQGDTKKEPKPSGSAVAPSSSADPVTPTQRKPSTSPDLPLGGTPLRSDEPDVGPTLPTGGGDDEPLGGLLGNLFGKN
jgi:hypothetical protein